jgi:PTH1 family peptidyl-tRNA hydrolase
MKLLVGLGNPGKKYRKTRHNLGFMVLDALLQELEPVEKTGWKKDQNSNSLIAKINDLILVKPQTMMNASGFALSTLARFYKIKPEDIWVIHDDVDLPLGKIKIRLGGAAAGHHGVESVIEKLGTDKFVRFRLGISHPKEKLKIKEQKLKSVEKYVLTEFDFEETSEVKMMVKKIVKAIQIALEKGLDKAMNRFNQ